MHETGRKHAEADDMHQSSTKHAHNGMYTPVGMSNASTKQAGSTQKPSMHQMPIGERMRRAWQFGKDKLTGRYEDGCVYVKCI